VAEQSNLVPTDHPHLLGLLQAALDLRPAGEDGLLPKYDPRALLVLADWLEEQGDPRAADVRDLGAVRFVLPAGRPTSRARPVACGPWWSVTLRHPRPGHYVLSWRAYPGTEQYRRVADALCAEATRSASPSPPARSRTVPGEVGYYSSEALVRYGCEWARLTLAAGLLGTTCEYLTCRGVFLEGDDATVATYLACRYPPPHLVQALQERDAERYTRLRERADVIVARLTQEAEELMAEHAGPAR
jgi:hypothetical protein